jgi:hypothetical protein
MDKIFGEADAVVAGETTTELKMEDVQHQENSNEPGQTNTSITVADKA